MRSAKTACSTASAAVRVACSCKSTPVLTLQQVCLFSYGQTGAGKTHTMQGSASAEGRGITPRALEQVCRPTVCCASAVWLNPR